MSLFPKKYDRVGGRRQQAAGDDEDVEETAALISRREDDAAGDADTAADGEFAGGGRGRRDGGGGGGGRGRGAGIYYGSTSSASRMSVTTLQIQERGIVVGKPALLTKAVHHQIAEVVYLLFLTEHPHAHNHPRTSPMLPPEKRFARHRNFYIYWLNQFRHWWKTSRLLVRVSGGAVYCQNPLAWNAMAAWDVTLRRQAKAAAKQAKNVGQGGPMKVFLDQVQGFTRSIRIILACARAWEARVDNRFYEVGLAEAFAFMGNRCSRYWSREVVDYLTRWVALPLWGQSLASHLPQQSRPVIVAMGFFRAILPFAMSFQGSRLGRQLTFNTYKYAYYRWKSMQSVMRFHELTGTYQDTNLDPQLLWMARRVAEVIGHGADPVQTRANLAAIGFEVFGTGSGGYSVYRLVKDDKIITLHVTPYGPSILDEMPRYVLLERRRRFYMETLFDESDANILDAATPREAKVRGFTYSGAFFQSQEWAALKYRFDRELEDYGNACRIAGTHALPRSKRNPQEVKSASPPTDLESLKNFIRSGRQTFKQYRDNSKWKEIQRQVDRMAKLVAKHQRDGKAPTRVILYLEGLDCAGKSSTGGLICQALEECGYHVTTAQHNRPPTAEQRKKPWMDRGRFEYPQDMYESEDEVPDFAGVVWDRGPAGDFVYGTLHELPLSGKLQRYSEFRKYDYDCRADGVLFLKCFFVTDRDSIAKTLGKRLAHKKIVGDLRKWLDANSVAHAREGLEAIEMHIDPTDFVAFNKYEENLHKFSEFARNTDYVGNFGDRDDDALAGYSNPWLVISTSDRHSARLNLVKAFCDRLNGFASIEGESRPWVAKLLSFCGLRSHHAPLRDAMLPAVPNDVVEEREHGLSIRAVFQSVLLLLLFFAYAHQTWNFSLEDIT